MSRLTSQLNCKVFEIHPKSSLLVDLSMWTPVSQLKDSELKSTELQERVIELESLLAETQAACREREVQLESLRQREADFSSTRHR